MQSGIDLEQIERKTYLSYHSDGIWDLFAGLSFVGMALGLIYGNTGIAAIFPALAIIMVPALKRCITSPRLGYVKFASQREEKEKRNVKSLIYLMSLTAVLGLVVFSGYTGDSAWHRWIKSLALIPFGLVLSTIAGAVGLLYGIKRVLFYSVLILATFVIGHVLELRPAFHFSVIGIPITLVGVVMFLRFIINNPKPTKGDSSVV
jgi:hypothetical protein